MSELLISGMARQLPLRKAVEPIFTALAGNISALLLARVTGESQALQLSVLQPSVLQLSTLQLLWRRAGPGRDPTVIVAA